MRILLLRIYLWVSVIEEESFVSKMEFIRIQYEMV